MNKDSLYPGTVQIDVILCTLDFIFVFFVLYTTVVLLCCCVDVLLTRLIAPDPTQLNPTQLN